MTPEEVLAIPIDHKWHNETVRRLRHALGRANEENQVNADFIRQYQREVEQLKAQLATAIAEKEEAEARFASLQHSVGEVVARTQSREEEV